MTSFKVHYTFLNDEMEYACNAEAHDADDAETRFMGDITEDERQSITITSVEAI